MLLHWPGAVEGGQTRAELVSMMDLMPTALDAAGVPLPAGLDGRSLLPLLAGKEDKVHDYLMWVGIHARAWGFWGETTIGAPPHSRRNESPGAWTVSDGRYLLRFVGETPAGLYNDAPGGIPAHYEMHDITADPLESNNIHGDHPEIAERLEHVYETGAQTLPPPSRWPEDRWREILPAGHSRAEDAGKD